MNLKPGSECALVIYNSLAKSKIGLLNVLMSRVTRFKIAVHSFKMPTSVFGTGFGKRFDIAIGFRLASDSL